MMIFTDFLLPLSSEQEVTKEYDALLAYADMCSGSVTLLTIIENLDEIAEISEYSCSALNVIE